MAKEDTLALRFAQAVHEFADGAEVRMLWSKVEAATRDDHDPYTYVARLELNGMFTGVMIKSSKALDSLSRSDLADAQLRFSVYLIPGAVSIPVKSGREMIEQVEEFQRIGPPVDLEPIFIAGRTL